MKLVVVVKPSDVLEKEVVRVCDALEEGTVWLARLVDKEELELDNGSTVIVKGRV